MSTSLLAFLLLLPAAPPAQPVVPARFTAARFREHVAYLSSDELAGRDVGSAGSARAMQYIVDHLKQYGGQGLGAGGDYFQAFPFITRVKLRPQTSLAVEGGPGFTAGQDFVLSPLAPDGRWRGELVFVGYGISAPRAGYDDFAGVDLKGKVALMLEGVPKLPPEAGAATSLEQRWQECGRRGAVAVISVGPKGPFRRAAVQSVHGEVATQTVPVVLMAYEAAGKLLGSAEGQADPVAAAVASLSADGKPRPRSRPLGRTVRLRVELDRSPVIARNVLAVVRGKGDLAREAILVSAHHDHLGINEAWIKQGKDGIYNGADDNASGCAAVLLIAEALHADRERLPASYRSVIFATFDAEERGLIGSRYYVTHPLWPLERTAADLNFDMVGRLQQRKVLAGDSESNAFLTQRILALALACGLRVETRLSGVRRADNASFLDREIPGIHFSSGLHPDYHQVTDEVARIDAAGGARIAWMVYHLLRDTMEAPNPLRYQRPPPRTDVESIIQFILKLGIIPEQNAQVGRYPLVRFVLPLSPAARHGLQSGDEILGLEGSRFDGLEDAAIAFGRVRLDRDLHLSVGRKGKVVEVTIPAAVFKHLAGPAVRASGKDKFEVLFRYRPSGKVQSVALAGTFNKWDVKSRPMAGPDKDGAYTARMLLAPGTYEYKFVVSGTKWEADPTNFRRAGPNHNSVLIVGDRP
jgi:hypothetical protein